MGVGILLVVMFQSFLPVILPRGGFSSFEGPCGVVGGVLTPVTRQDSLSLDTDERVGASKQPVLPARGVWEWFEAGMGGDVGVWSAPRWWRDVKLRDMREWEKGRAETAENVPLERGYGDGSDPNWLQGWLQWWGLGLPKFGYPRSCFEQAKELWQRVEEEQGRVWLDALDDWDAMDAVKVGDDLRVSPWGVERYGMATRREGGLEVSVDSVCRRLSFGELEHWELRGGEEELGGKKGREGLQGWFEVGVGEGYGEDVRKGSRCFPPLAHHCTVSSTSLSNPLALLDEPGTAAEERKGDRVCFGPCGGREWGVFVAPGEIDVKWEGDGKGKGRKTLKGTKTAVAEFKAYLQQRAQEVGMGGGGDGGGSLPACPNVVKRMEDACFVFGGVEANHSFLSALAVRGKPQSNAVYLSLDDVPCPATCSIPEGNCTREIDYWNPLRWSWLNDGVAMPGDGDTAGRRMALQAAATLQAPYLESHATLWETYRPGYDIALPLPVIKELNPRPPQVPPVALLSFAGKTYNTGNARVRRHLASLHNGRDVLMALNCHITECHTMMGSQFQELRTGLGANVFNDYLTLSWFCLVPAGRSPTSFRVLESAHTGCLPIFLDAPESKPWVPPLFSLIPWEKVLIHTCVAPAQDCHSLPHSDFGKWPTKRVPLHQLVPFLRSLPVDLRSQKRELLLRLYYRYLRTEENDPANPRQSAHINRPLALAMRILHDRIHT